MRLFNARPVWHVCKPNSSYKEWADDGQNADIACCKRTSFLTFNLFTWSNPKPLELPNLSLFATQNRKGT